MNTNTKFLGLDVKSPIIAGSCGLTNNIEDLEKLEAAGAGAIILKSIFEEQIIFDIKHSLAVYAPIEQYGESYEYVAAHVGENAMEQYFNLIREAKKRIHIPIVGSINCFQFENWITYASRFEEAGCDALELNISLLPTETSVSTDDVDRLYQNIISSIKKSVTIPISIKVSNYFTDLTKFMEQLSWRGIAGITTFNKTINIDIDLEHNKLISAPSLSAPEDMYNTLRWVAILSKKIRCELSASTGIHTSDDVVKMLLAGAQSVQVVSCLYQNGVDYMRTLNDGLKQWMVNNKYNSIDQFRGKFAVKSNENASMFLRTQFMRYLSEL